MDTALNVEKGRGIQLLGQTEGTRAQSITLLARDQGVYVLSEQDAEADSKAVLTADSIRIMAPTALAAHGSHSIIDLQGTMQIKGDLVASRKPGETSRGGSIFLSYAVGDNEILGDISSANEGRIVVSGAEGASIDITGDVTTGDVPTDDEKPYTSGTVDLSLGHGLLKGSVTDNHLKFSKGADSDPAGTTLRMDSQAAWAVTKNSYVTSVSAKAGSVIRMHNAVGDEAYDSDFLYIHKLEAPSSTVSTISDTSSEGPSPDALHVFMNLDHTDHAKSDMLYIQNGSGSVEVLLEEALTDEELKKIEEGEDLRFATVGKDVSIDFTAASVRDQGLYDRVYTVEKKEYDTSASEENDSYNQKIDSEHDGSDFVDNHFGDGYNWVITADQGGEISDGGEAILDLSRANYANALYQLDTLNRRMGEARFKTGTEDGLWVRTRYDRFGLSGSFRSRQTMFEIGYDVLSRKDDGEHHRGIAVDYMDGEAEYHGLSGAGKMDRWGIWAYDTWLADNGTYADVVFKWGHLKNDFDITVRDTGTRVSGGYSNDVFSLSGEFGRKFVHESGWFVEPQGQLQYAYITSEDYCTNQGTRVDLDAVSSLIARAGARVGRSLNDENRWFFWLQADVLHEFLGKQKIRAEDGTGTLDDEFHNEGTWWDVGFGLSGKLGDSSYVHLNAAKEMGNDRTSSYTISGGLSLVF